MGECRERCVAVSARAQPDGDRDADGRSQPDRVPVAERLTQPRVGLLLGQGAGQDLRQQRVDADRDGGDQHGAEHRAPALRRESHQGGSRREHEQPGQPGVGLDPCRVGADRPGDREAHQRDQSRQQRDRCDAPWSPRIRREDECHGAQQPADDVEDGRDQRERLQLKPATGMERRRDDAGRQRQRQERTGRGAPAGRRGGSTPARRRGRHEVRTGGWRGHAWRLRRRALRWRRERL